MPKTTPLITAFVMTEKGLLVLRETLPRYAHLFGRVVVGSDKSLQ